MQLLQSMLVAGEQDPALQAGATHRPFTLHLMLRLSVAHALSFRRLRPGRVCCVQRQAPG